MSQPQTRLQHHLGQAASSLRMLGDQQRSTLSTAERDAVIGVENGEDYLKVGNLIVICRS